MESEYGKGSTFTFVLKLDREKEVSEQIDCENLIVELEKEED